MLSLLDSISGKLIVSYLPKEVGGSVHFHCTNQSAIETLRTRAIEIKGEVS